MKSSKEIHGWVSKKGFKSLLNTSNDSIYMQSDYLDNKRVIYSDAIKAILNNEHKFKINGNVIWANEQNLYLLNENNLNLNNQELINQIKDLRIYGNILNKSNFSKGVSNSRVIIPNENRSREWSVGYNSAGRDRRIILTLFNETIILNNVTTSSKMFIRCVRQGKYCSFWKCRWNEEFEPKQLALNIYSISDTNSGSSWQTNPSLYYYDNITYISSNNNTILLSTALLSFPYAIPSNFLINATAYVTTLNGSQQYPYNWTQQISWY